MMQYPNKKVKWITYTAVFSGLALILSYLESLVYLPFALPGMKLGLANIVIIICVYKFGFKQALIVNIIRILIMSILFGNLYSFLYSISAGIVSLLLMYIVKKYTKMSIYGVSVTGAVIHNITQICVASIVLKNFYIFTYAPILIVTGIITGIIIGLIAGFVDRRISVSIS